MWSFRREPNTFRGNQSFRLLSVRQRLESIRLRPICQFAYVLTWLCTSAFLRYPVSSIEGCYEDAKVSIEE